MNEELTPWFPAHVRPVRKGVYERLTPEDSTPTFQYWDGEAWGYQATTPRTALVRFGISLFQFDHQWRGLASDPKASKL